MTDPEVKVLMLKGDKGDGLSDDDMRKVKELIYASVSDAKANINDSLNAKLANARYVPEIFANSGELKKAYPNGKDGIFVMADTGRMWLFVNGNWADVGVYQTAGVDETLKRKGVPADAKAVGDVMQGLDFLKGGTKIPADSDLDSYSQVGNYYVESNDDAVTLSNCPTVKGGLLKVYEPEGTKAHLVQHYLAFEGVRFREYKRWCDSSNLNWSDWVTITSNVDENFLLKGGTKIPANSDLDSYSQVGNYYVESNDDAVTLSNCPTVKGGLLKVYEPEVPGIFVVQHYLAFEDKYFREYKRWRNLGSPVAGWSEWVTITDNMDNVDLLTGGTEIPANSDLNDYKDVGNYYISADSISKSIKNIPYHSSGQLKVYIPNGIRDSVNRAQHFISSDSRHLNEYKRTFFHNSWTNWIKVSGANANGAKATSKLTVMSYNVQWFSGRNANTIMQDAIIRKFNPDIIGLQEFREYTPAAQDVSVTSGMDVWSTIFKDYEYTHLAKFGNTNYKGNASKLEMFDITDEAFDVWHGEVRGYTKCYIMVNGKKICWINTHLATTDLQADKIAQANQIVNLVKDEPYFIVTGDFNTRHEPELGEFNSIMKPFLDIGANTANFKAADDYIFTYCDGRDFSSGNKYPHDHIITSANISIDKVFADNTKYMSMFMDSNQLDHVPLVAFLTVN